MKDQPARQTVTPLTLAHELSPHGTISIYKVKGTKPERVVGAVIQESNRQLDTAHAASIAVSDLETFPETNLTVQGIAWVDRRRSTSFRGLRTDLINRYAVVATDGRYVAISTNSDRMRNGLRRWTRGPKQGYVTEVGPRVFRSLRDDRIAVAAWLRNTSTRDPQFVAMAVSGRDVGRGAVAADLCSYLASTVRVTHPVSKDVAEDVTVNPEHSKLTFRRTDKIGTWAEFVDIAFAWIGLTEQRNTNEPIFLPGASEPVQTLEGVGAPYDMMLTHVIPDPPSDDRTDDYEPEPSTITFHVPPDQGPQAFRVTGLIDGSIVGEYDVHLASVNDRWEARFGAVRECDHVGGAALRAAVDQQGIEIHFESEHLYSNSAVTIRSSRAIPFRSYQWHDFSDHDVTLEKPSNSATIMRRLLGTEHDRSLFGWVTRQPVFRKGWLICDDGAHETSDFIHVHDDELNLIAVKAAKSNGTSTSTEAVQLVQAQATKNLLFIDDIRELTTILHRRRNRLVVFKDGQRQENPEAFLRALGNLRPGTVSRTTTIIQPQLRQPEVARAHTRMGLNDRGTNVLTMIRIDELFRAVDQRCANLGIHFIVVGSL